MGHYSNILFIVVLIGVFYALLIMPQKRQQKQRAAMMKQLAPGAKVLTHAGIFGEIISMKDDVLVIRVAPDVELQFDPRAIARVTKEAPASAPEA